MNSGEAVNPPAFFVMALKRFNKFVRLENAVERLAGHHPNRAFGQHLAELSPRVVFGDNLGAHVTGLVIDGNRLIIKISDPLWHREMQAFRGKLLDRARRTLPHLTSIDLIV